MLLLKKMHTGADDDVETAKTFIRDKFLNMVPEDGIHAQDNIYSHFTCSVGKSLILC
jgi:hypothetical protein